MQRVLTADKILNLEAILKFIQRAPADKFNLGSLSFLKFCGALVASKFHFPLRANTSFVPLKASVYDGGANVGEAGFGILRKILKVSARNGA